MREEFYLFHRSSIEFLRNRVTDRPVTRGLHTQKSPIFQGEAKCKPPLTSHWVCINKPVNILAEQITGPLQVKT